MSLNVVLFQPEIPSNTGNIGRLCVGCSTVLHIIKPMRFLLTDKYLKRAGLDYWEHLELKFYDSLQLFLDQHHDKRLFFFSTKGRKYYSEVEYVDNDFLVFGAETKGLPAQLLEEYKERVIKIPMSDKIRSINLSNSVAVVLYEAWRQIGFNN
jgi:tRNA (cytidine/uridine-2'-O-)-methyltransferase